MERLSGLAMRSKAYWGYDVGFLEACRGALAVTKEHMRDCEVFVLEAEDQVVGFYCLSRGENAELNALFVEPECIGRGFGRSLFEHAVITAKRIGLGSFAIAADPFAEGFYLKMGAVSNGWVDSDAIQGRKLPLLKFEL